MSLINISFVSVIYFILLFDNTKQSHVKQAITTLKAIGKTIKNPLVKQVCNTIKKPVVKTFGNTIKNTVGMFGRNKNTVKNFAFGLQEKYQKTRHSFGSKSVKYLGEQTIQKFKYIAPYTVGRGKKNIQMRSASYMNGKELKSLINIVSRSKPQLPLLLVAGGLGTLTKFNLLPPDDNIDLHDHKEKIDKLKERYANNDQELIKETQDANLFFKNLDPKITSEQLEEECSKYGSVISCVVKADIDTGRPLGYGYVQFQTSQNSKDCVSSMNKMKLGDKKISVSHFLPRNKRQKHTAKYNLYIKRFPDDWKKQKIEEYIQSEFSKYGKISSHAVLEDKNISKYFAFVAFDEQEAAREAIVELNDFEVSKDKKLYVGYAQDKAARKKNLEYKSKTEQENPGINKIFIENNIDKVIEPRREFKVKNKDNIGKINTTPIFQSLKPRVLFANNSDDQHEMIGKWLNDNSIGNECTYKLVNVNKKSQLSSLNFDAEILVVQFVSKEQIDKTIEMNPKIRWIHSLRTGVDNICKSTNLNLPENKIVLTNSKGCFSQILAEFGLFGILWHSKRGDHWRNLQKQSKWEKGTVSYTGTKTLGIVGYGDIGYHIAKAAKSALNMKVIALKKDRNNISPAAKYYTDELVEFSGLKHLCKYSDYVISLLPNTEETKGVFNKDVFAKMKPSSCFMNLGRGESVIEKDLVEALENKVIDAAVLDVFTPEPLPKTSKLWKLENVFITPHSADNVDNLSHISCNKWLKLFNDQKNGDGLSDIVNIKKGY